MFMVRNMGADDWLMVMAQVRASWTGLDGLADNGLQLTFTSCCVSSIRTCALVPGTLPSGDILKIAVKVLSSNGLVVAADGD
jgi:hypothetical protein